MFASSVWHMILEESDFWVVVTKKIVVFPTCLNRSSSRILPDQITWQALAVAEINSASVADNVTNSCFLEDHETASVPNIKTCPCKILRYGAREKDDCIPAGQYARLHIKEVPTLVASKLCLLAKRAHVIASGLFQHESKMYVLHFRYSGVYTAVYSFQFFRNRLHYFNFSHNMFFQCFSSLRSMIPVMLLSKPKKN